MDQCSDKFSSAPIDEPNLTANVAINDGTTATVEQATQLPAQADHQLAAYDYGLPEDLIAQNPAVPRDSARCLVVDSLNTHQHRHFRDLVDLLLPGDLLVLNNTRVIPARLLGQKQTDHKQPGAAVEVLLIEPISDDRWLALVKPGRRLQPGSKIAFGHLESSPENPLETSIRTPLMTAFVEAREKQTNGRILRLVSQCDRSIETLIHQLGQVPLPPYITHSEALPEQYQTVFAHRQGAIAAPTAGLHFTERLLSQLTAKGIETTEVTLHVGIGTFRPVEATDIETHQMHQERIEVPASTVEKIRQAKASGGRVIAVGTTSTRALEGAAAACGDLQPYSGKTELFIYPGYQWQVIDGLITNFHLPGSSLLMMVSALMGRQRLMEIYAEAIAHQYRFYSFGDAMLILPEATIIP
ncbi:MAG: tRNA preQ1(34) S-adenosylmethionine ribosyltransferase-isomerase QueA [Phormidesmis sp.]